MITGFIPRLLIGTLAAALAACGGGGGGDGGGPTLPPPPVSLPSALNFKTPSTFVNGESYVTGGSLVSITGELNSATTPSGYCPDRQPPQNYSVQWSNAANGKSGTTPIAIGCVTIVGFSGIKSQFTTDSILLENGNNRISFDTFQGSTQLGHDQVLIIREDRVAPQVSRTHPSDGQQDVPTDHALIVIFNEAMSPATLTGDRFVVLDAMGAPVAGQVEYVAGNHAWTFRPSAPLAPASSYSVTVNGSIEDAGGGNALGSDYTWGFVTGPGADNAVPSVATEWPGSNCDCAPVSTRILAGLDEFADPGSVTSSTMAVTAAGAPVAGTTVYRGDFVEFVPDLDLVQGQTYTVTVSAALQDAAGQPMAADHSWQFTTDSRTPAGSWSETSLNGAPPAMSGATAVWSGTEVLIWGYAGAGRYDPAANNWDVTGSIPAGGPSPRIGHSAVWTGTEMIIWGGRSSTTTNTEIFSGGGSLNVALEQWSEITAPAAQGSYGTFDHAAIWTGTEMIVWGGMANTGGSLIEPVNSGWRYSPATGIAAPFSGANAPSPRTSTHAVWTGTEMIVWGGFDDTGTPLNDGARYDPVSDTWTALPPVPASLVPGLATSMVWTGTEVIVWNGGQTEEGQTRNDRLRVPTLHFYDPLLDTWRASTSGWEPYLAGADPFVLSLASGGYLAFWTGDRMFVAGLYPRDSSYFYDPTTDSWQVAAYNISVWRKGGAAAWAGSRFVIWGGTGSVFPRDDGLVFQP